MWKNVHTYNLNFLYHDFKLPIRVVELSIKGIHVIYANVILQCLKVFPVLWSSIDQIKSTLSSSLRKIMFLLHSAKSPIDPSFFFMSLKDAFTKVGRSSFNLHAQQNVVEILEIVLEELTGPAIVTSVAYNIKRITSIICHTTYTSYLYFLFLFFQSHLTSFRNRIFDWVQRSILKFFSDIRESDSRLSLWSVGNCLHVALQ